MTRRTWMLAVVGLMLLGSERATAGVTAKALAAAEKWFARTTGRAAAEGVEGLARQADTLAAKFGPDALTAIEKVGPRAVRAAEEAGEHAGPALRAAARHGEAGVTHVAARPGALRLVARHGDEAADALVKHHGAVESVVELGGADAVRALNRVGGQNGRRLAMLAEGGELAAMGHTPQVLDVIAKYGDPAADFVWRHKGALAVAGATAAFVANPEPFITGTRDLATIAADAAVKPLAQAPGAVATEAARRTDWTIVAVTGLVLAAGYGVWRSLPGLSRRAGVTHSPEGKA